MNLIRLSRTRNAVIAAFLAICAATLSLAGVLVVRAAAPRPIIVVPGVREEAVLSPGKVPDEAARAFAMLYVACFDNYTPSTVEDVSGRVRKRVAPSYWARASEALLRREKISKEGRMCSQVILAGPEEVVVERGSGLVVAVPAYRRTFLAGKPAQEGFVEYRLRLETAVPGPGNACGLVVAGQVIREVEREDR